MNLHSYPKVYGIGHAAILELFLDPVLVEEKIDGSQFSFGIIDGELQFRSRGAEINRYAPDNMFAAGVSNVVEISNSLTPGWAYRCEYLQKPKHNTLCYSRTPRRNLILFDINTGDEIYLSRKEKDQEAERVGLELVPVLHEGMVENPEQLYSFLERESILGGQKVEGVVVKNYMRFGRDKKVLMGKYVREDFKEKHSKEWRASNPTISDVVGRLVSILRSEKRWEKAVFHLRDRGVLENSPRDIGSLIKEVKEDIRAEEMEYIKEKLAEYALPRILRSSTAGLPEWYKKKLVEKSFEEIHSG